MTTDDMIEAEVRLYCGLIAASGAEPTVQDKHRYREALRMLVKLAQSEYMLMISSGMLSNDVRH